MKTLALTLLALCLFALPASAQTVIVRPAPVVTVAPPTVTVCTPGGCVVEVRRPLLFLPRLFWPRPVVVVQPQAAPTAAKPVAAAPYRVLHDGSEFVVFPDGGELELTRSIKAILEGSPQPWARERKDFSGNATPMIVQPPK